jgi:2-keto-4-pentenoate hydratase/2-oxohepta-3-ene-1,7-dioic acid hydratase in catechol pathway
MIWNVVRVVEYASQVMTLKAGDLLSTGTPDGVGPHRLGDQVTMEVGRVGRLSVSVELLRP